MLNRNKITKPKTKNKLSNLLLISGILVTSSANALDVNSGTFIQTIHTDALQQSANMTVNDFFEGEASLTRLTTDFENREDTVLGPPPLTTNQFIYSINSTSFVSPSQRTIPTTNFTFNPENITESAQGRIGLNGILRFDLSDNRFFILGDWSIQYDESRKDHGGSGWYMKNLYQLPGIAFDLLNQTVISGPDSFYLSGDLGWSPEFTEGFSAVIPKSELLKVISSFSLCAQDDNAFSSNPAQQIPCVFPNIKANGQTDLVTLDSQDNLNLTVDLGIASQKNYPNADYFVAFVYEGTFYWLNKNFQWTTEASPAYQGALINLNSITIPSPTLDFSPGSEVPIYFGVDTNQNGIFDEPYRFTSVSIKTK